MIRRRRNQENKVKEIKKVAEGEYKILTIIRVFAFGLI